MVFYFLAYLAILISAAVGAFLSKQNIETWIYNSPYIKADDKNYFIHKIDELVNDFYSNIGLYALGGLLVYVLLEIIKNLRG